ncbi:MAG TPA: hypothetical protein VGO09_07435 [Flavisolibacter sp.]|nr:hypothetical protein [Flavisolibacter sp.]
MKINSINPFYSSILFTSISFLLLLVFCKPILNSDDDIYFLYTLAGGYGNKPTFLLHYSYGWNPLISWPVSIFFKWQPAFNWYSLLLIFIQFLSCLNITYWLFATFKKATPLIYSIAYFLFFQSAFLLSLNYSNTSFIAAISGGSSLLLYYFNKNEKIFSSKRHLFFSLSLLLISGLLRMHGLLLINMLLLWIGLFCLPFQFYKKFFTVIFTSFLFVLFLAFLQNYYYTTRIPGWKTEEKQRQSFYYIINHPRNENILDTGLRGTKNAFIQNWFVYDTSFISSNDLESFSNKRISNRIKTPDQNISIANWTYINIRVYLILFLSLLIPSILKRDLRTIRQWGLMLIGPIGLFFFLSIFLKVTIGIYITLFYSIFFSGIICLNKTIKIRRSYLVLSFLLLTNCTWMFIRIYKINKQNIASINTTRCLFKELKNNKDLLFVATNLDFNDNGYYIWDTPAEFPLNNILNKDLLITNSYKETLQHFKINNLMDDLLFKTNIILIGDTHLMLEDYYFQKFKIRIKLIPDPKFKCLDAFKIMVN